MMTCQQVSTLVSMGSLEREPIARRMGLWMHLAMCRRCRAFRRQLILMGRMGQSIASEFASEPPLDFEGKILDRLGS